MFGSATPGAASPLPDACSRRRVREVCEVNQHATVCFFSDPDMYAYIADCASRIHAVEVQSILRMSDQQRVDFFKRIERKRPADSVQSLRREVWAKLQARRAAAAS
jgi:hypothetical protein